MKKETIVFLVGVFIFGYFYEGVKGFIDNSILFVGTAVVYFLLLKWLCKMIRSKGSDLIDSQPPE